VDAQTIIQLLTGLATALATVAGTAWIAGKSWQGMSDRMDSQDSKLNEITARLNHIENNDLVHVKLAYEDIIRRLARMGGATSYKIDV